jgi:hypothetical protein
MDPEQAAVRFGFREISLERADARHRAETVSASNGGAEEDLVRGFLARHAPSA